MAFLLDFSNLQKKWVQMINALNYIFIYNIHHFVHFDKSTDWPQDSCFKVNFY